MNIHEYIQSFANIDNNNQAKQIKKSTALLPNKYQRVKNGYSHLPDQSDQKNSIRPTLLHDLGLNDLSHLKKRFKEFQQKYIKETAKESSVTESYTTASSETEGSYVTALEDLNHLKISTNDLESEILFDSGIDAGKRELIRRLLRSKANGFDDREDCHPDCLRILSETEDLFSGMGIEQRHWNDCISEELMYKDRISRIFQPKGDQNLHYPTLKIDFDIDSQHVPVKKDFPPRTTSRQYFMSLTDEDISEFEKRESSESTSFREDYRTGARRNYSPSR